MGRSMRDAVGDVQSALVLGGNSEIAVATLELFSTRRLQRAVLAVRDEAAAASTVAMLQSAGVDATTESYDATDVDAHARVLEAAGDVDVVMVAFGELGPAFAVDGFPGETAVVADVGFTAAVTACHAAAAHLCSQGHGSLVVLTSVAGVRTRAANAVYGAAKAGLDAFVSALDDALHGTGVHVMVVRPGFVHTKMTAGMDAAPFATTPEAVAGDIVDGLASRARVVWSPPLLRGVFAGLRRLPRPLWRRLGA